MHNNTKFNFESFHFQKILYVNNCPCFFSQNSRTINVNKTKEKKKNQRRKTNFCFSTTRICKFVLIFYINHAEE